MPSTQLSPAADFLSGKGHRNENFPVASLLLAPGKRKPILAFYRFARLADDVADHPALAPERKLALLDAMEEGLDGAPNADPRTAELREILRERGLRDDPAHLLLQAFRQDVTVSRCHSWLELMDYCVYSAMPVGRFVLDVHGEARATRSASDAICAALQIINHLQDCVKDYRELDRVYIPLDMLARNGAGVEDLRAAKASPGLLKTIRHLAGRADQLLDIGEELPALIEDRHLAREVEVIIALARNNAARLQVEDPLQGGGRTSRPRALLIAVATLLRSMARAGAAQPKRTADDAGA